MFPLPPWVAAINWVEISVSLPATNLDLLCFVLTLVGVGVDVDVDVCSLLIPLFVIAIVFDFLGLCNVCILAPNVGCDTLWEGGNLDGVTAFMLSFFDVFFVTLTLETSVGTN